MSVNEVLYFLHLQVKVTSKPPWFSLYADNISAVGLCTGESNF